MRDDVGIGFRGGGFGNAESPVGSGECEEFAERSLHVRHSNPVLGPFRSGDTRFNVAQVDFQDIGIMHFAEAWDTEDALRFEICLD